MSERIIEEGWAILRADGTRAFLPTFRSWGGADLFLQTTAVPTPPPVLRIARIRTVEVIEEAGHE